MDSKEPPVAQTESDIQGEIEAIAMSKVRDLDGISFVTHGTTYEKLPDILRQGIIAGDFAQRIGHPTYSSEWDQSHNRKFVSTVEGYITWGDEVEVIIRKPKDASQERNLTPGSREVLIRHRVAPREFLGIAASIPERHKQGYETRLQRVVEDAIEIWKARPQDAVPFYNLLDNSLVWPKKMTHDELVDMLKNK